MADLQKMERTWLCSVLFMDIVNYSSQSVDMQMKWKTRFNGYLADAIRDVPESERVILDTGDGAAVCFLGSPEAAMFAAFHLWQCFVHDEREHQPGLRVRTGVNLGPVKLVKDLNGSLNAIGDGINVGQRVMSFAPDNQILVSQSYFEVVSRLSDDYKTLFKLKGVETDKHVREHTVYSLLPPGSAKWEAETPVAPAPHPVEAAPVARVVPAAPAGPGGGDPVRVEKRRSLALPAIGALVILVSALVGWRIVSSAGTKGSPATNVPAENPPVAREPSVSTSKPSPDKDVVKSAVEAQAPPKPSPAGKLSAKNSQTPAGNVPEGGGPKRTTPQAGDKLMQGAQVAYDEGMRLIDEKQPSEAVQHFDGAIRANPNFVLAYLGRAEARRLLSLYELSIADCNHAMQINPEEPRVYFCRGLGEGLLTRYDLAVRDYGEAIRLNPKFAPAFEMRGVANSNLEQYGRALEDFNRAILLKPSNAQSYVRRAMLYEKLKQYDKEIQDYDQAIRLEPGDARAYNGRANAKKLSGDSSGAAADKRYARQLKER